MPNGFRKAQEPTKRDLQLEIQKLKAQVATASVHLTTMGPFMERMMRAHFEILGMANGQGKRLTLRLSMGPGKLAEVRKTLGDICRESFDFAVEYRKLNDPSFTVDKQENIDKVAEDLPGPNEVVEAMLYCTNCDWNGLEAQAITGRGGDLQKDGHLLCPLCSHEVTGALDESGD